MQSRIIRVYQRLMVRRRFYRLNRLLYFLSLRGLGILNFDNEMLSGEAHFIKQLSKLFAGPVVFDVGANRGLYAAMVRTHMPSARILAFEPHPQSFEQLRDNAARHDYHAFNLALGPTTGQVALYDYAGSDAGSQHATMYRSVIEKLHGRSAQASIVQMTTIDQVLEDQALDQINFLKLDTEGHELSVLQGAKRAIRQRQIDIIQFEFNEMNIVSRVFFSDFFDALSGFEFFRMLPDGLVSLGAYSPQFCELFAFQNIIATRPGFKFPV